MGASSDPKRALSDPPKATPAPLPLWGEVLRALFWLACGALVSLTLSPRAGGTSAFLSPPARPLVWHGGSQLQAYSGSSATWYRENPYLGLDFDFKGAAASLLGARAHLAEVGLQRDPVDWEVFDAAPAESGCVNLTLMFIPEEEGGGGKAESKLVCNPGALAPGCVVYSFGSANRYDFEDTMLRSVPCEVHTFDCTIDPDPARKDPRIHFHKWCLGSPGQPEPFMALPDIMKALGHATVDLLKIDIEGFEYFVVEALYRSHLEAAARGDEADLGLPLQMCIEFHVRAWNQPHSFSCKWYSLEGPNPPCPSLTKGDAALPWVQLSDMGYAVAHRENNVRCAWAGDHTWRLAGSFLFLYLLTPPVPLFSFAALVAYLHQLCRVHACARLQGGAIAWVASSPYFFSCLGGTQPAPPQPALERVFFFY